MRTKKEIDDRINLIISEIDAGERKYRFRIIYFLFGIVAVTFFILKYIFFTDKFYFPFLGNGILDEIYVGIVAWYLGKYFMYTDKKHQLKYYINLKEIISTPDGAKTCYGKITDLVTRKIVLERKIERGIKISKIISYLAGLSFITVVLLLILGFVYFTIQDLYLFVLSGLFIFLFAYYGIINDSTNERKDKVKHIKEEIEILSWAVSDMGKGNEKDE